MRTEEIHQQFEEILAELRNIEGLPAESVVQVAQVILQESGKDRRTELIQENRLSNNGYNSNGSNNLHATDKQKNALTNFGIQFSEDITKADASELLDKAFEKLERNKKGSRKTPFLFSTDMNMKDEEKAVSDEVNEIYGDDMEDYLQSYPFHMSVN